MPSSCRLRGRLRVVQPIDKLLALRITITSLRVTTALDNVTSSYSNTTLTLHYYSPPYSFISKEISSSRYSDYVCIRRTEIRFPAGSRDSPLFRNVQTASGAHPDFHSVYSGSSIYGRGCKAVGREADHSPRYSVGVTTDRSCTSALLIRLRDVNTYNLPFIRQILPF